MRRLSLSLIAVLALGCATQPATPAVATAPAAVPCNSGLPLVNASLWVQSSAEYRAAALQTYGAARRALDSALASLPAGVKPAVVLDLDETSLDNSAFETRMIRKGVSYEQAEWTRWVNESAAVAVPGVVEFLAYARSRGVTPFYVTNRLAEEEPGTLANLEKLGFPLDAAEDQLLVRGERPEWAASDKTPRRDWVTQRYHTLLLLGDDLNDFTDAASKSAAERDAIISDNASRWGTEWFIIPNPMYGSWEATITGRGTECEKMQRKIDALR